MTKDEEIRYEEIMKEGLALRIKKDEEIKFWREECEGRNQAMINLANDCSIFREEIKKLQAENISVTKERDTEIKRAREAEAENAQAKETFRGSLLEHVEEIARLNAALARAVEALKEIADTLEKYERFQNTVPKIREILSAPLSQHSAEVWKRAMEVVEAARNLSDCDDKFLIGKMKITEKDFALDDLKTILRSFDRTVKGENKP